MSAAAAAAVTEEITLSGTVYFNTKQQTLQCTTAQYKCYMARVDALSSVYVEVTKRSVPALCIRLRFNRLRVQQAMALLPSAWHELSALDAKSEVRACLCDTVDEPLQSAHVNAGGWVWVAGAGPCVVMFKLDADFWAHGTLREEAEECSDGESTSKRARSD